MTGYVVFVYFCGFVLVCVVCCVCGVVFVVSVWFCVVLGVLCGSCFVVGFVITYPSIA